MAYRIVRVVTVSALAAAALCWSPEAAAQPSGKIGIVDLQRCIGESKMGKKYKTEFAAKAEQTKADLEKKEADLKGLRETLEKQGRLLSQEGRAEKEKEYREKADAFKEQYKATLQGLQRQDQELTGRILKDLQSVIREVGEAGGFALIVEKQEGGVLFAAKEGDVTDEVIRRYDQKAKGD